MAVFRAVENGKYLVRAANTGITAVVDPRGRVVERTALFERTRARARRAAACAGSTFYARHGDVFAWRLRWRLGRAAARSASRAPTSAPAVAAVIERLVE